MAADFRLNSKTLSVSGVVPAKKGISVMHQLFLSRRIFLLVPLFVASLACDGQSEGSAPQSPSAPEPARNALSDPSGSSLGQGATEVDVVFNAAPHVDAMVSSSGRVSSGASVTLQVVASDPDGDALGFSWSSSW